MTLEQHEEQTYFLIFRFLSFRKAFEADLLIRRKDLEVKASQTKNIDPNFFAHFETQKDEVNYEFPLLLRYALVISLFSLFESRSRSLCTILRPLHSPLVIGLNDIRGNLVERLQIYLAKLGKLPIVFRQSIDYWSTVHSSSVCSFAPLHSPLQWLHKRFSRSQEVTFHVAHPAQRFASDI